MQAQRVGERDRRDLDALAAGDDGGDAGKVDVHRGGQPQVNAAGAHAIARHRAHAALQPVAAAQLVAQRVRQRDGAAQPNVAPPTDEDLQAVLRRSITRLMKRLTRCGVSGRGPGPDLSSARNGTLSTLNLAIKAPGARSARLRAAKSGD